MMRIKIQMIKITINNQVIILINLKIIIRIINNKIRQIKITISNQQTILKIIQMVNQNQILKKKLNIDKQKLLLLVDCLNFGVINTKIQKYIDFLKMLKMIYVIILVGTVDYSIIKAIIRIKIMVVVVLQKVPITLNQV